MRGFGGFVGDLVSCDQNHAIGITMCSPIDQRLVRGLGNVELRGFPSARVSCDLYQLVCERDMEGVVGKLADGPYDPDAPTWGQNPVPGVYRRPRTARFL